MQSGCHTLSLARCSSVYLQLQYHHLEALLCGLKCFYFSTKAENLGADFQPALYHYNVGSICNCEMFNFPQSHLHPELLAHLLAKVHQLMQNMPSGGLEICIRLQISRTVAKHSRLSCNTSNREKQTLKYHTTKYFVCTFGRKLIS